MIETLNPVTVEVIGSALSSAVDEMGEALVRASHSTNIKERRDCSTALCTAEGEILCQAEHIPMHLGSFLQFVPRLMADYPRADLRPGDVFIGNDPYAGGGTHLPDIVMAEPIFVDGVLFGWAINTAHHSDFADRGHAHIYQEGLRIPPIRLQRDGQVQPEVMRLFLLNCQVPRERLSDLRAQMAANRLGVLRMQELCARYDAATVRAAGADLIAYAERKMRAGIAALPNGRWSFSDVFETESQAEHLTLAVELAISGDEMALSFDSPPQLRAGLNVIFTALQATVYYAVKSVVDPTILPNAGLARPLTIKAEPGTLLNCVHPAAVDGRISACQRVVDLVHGALAQVVPDKVSAAACGSVHVASFSGTRADGDLWVYLETIAGGSGARPDKDGLDAVQVHMTNTSNLPLEALGAEYPITLMAYEFAEDSGGDGTWLGGMGVRRVYRADADCRVQIMGARLTSRAWGLEGGGAGASGAFRINGDPRAIDLSGSADLAAGDIFEVITPGGGGYGDPARRTPSRREADSRSGRRVPGT
ncbi:MAG: hydantoinase B/oxoprolinase family protein [Rhodobacteraceae bacterium]|nr:hydantoinase B/oxoprolinase family protein [Paracoccaceae bacterium]